MNFDEIKQPLDEVRMAQSNLNQFLNSPRAEGMRSGFEAELCFRDMGKPDYDNVEYVNDYDQDESTDDINNIIRFFSENMGSGDINELRDSLWNDYMEWRDDVVMPEFYQEQHELIREYLEANEWDADAKIEEYMLEEMNLSKKEIQAALDAGREYGPKITSTKQQSEISKKDKNYANYLNAAFAVDDILDERVEEEIEERGDIYQTVLDDFSEQDEYSVNTWLHNQGLNMMSDIENNYVAFWPYMIPDEESLVGGYTESAAKELADNLESSLGVETVVSSRYHGESKDSSSWYFEPDGSLNPDSWDDLPVEIVSPPMELKDTHAIMPKFFAWVTKNGGYANKSTGFHMSLSMPNHEDLTIDNLKLALFLGDEHVLKTFSRQANNYCASSLDIIKKRLAHSSPEHIGEVLATAFDRMRKNLIQLASQAMSTSGQTKFVTINNRGNYIEFRSAGGADYFTDIPRVQNTLLRYAYTMSIASDPGAERQEYAKKLYKFLSDVVKNESDAMQYFIKYSAGELPRSALVSFVKQARLNREREKQKPAATPTQDTGSQDWEIINTRNGNVRVEALRAVNREHAYNQALLLARRLSSNPDLVRLPSWWDLRQIQPETN